MHAAKCMGSPRNQSNSLSRFSSVHGSRCLLPRSANACFGRRILCPRAPRYRTSATYDSLSEAEIESAIVHPSRLILVNFTATWCGPCQLVKKELVKVDKELSAKADIIVVDVDKHAELARKYQIQSLPTVVVLGFADHVKPAVAAQGFVPAKVIKDMLLNKSQFAGRHIAKRVRLY